MFVVKLTRIFFIHSDLEARRDVRKEEVNLTKFVNIALFYKDLNIVYLQINVQLKVKML